MNKEVNNKRKKRRKLSIQKIFNLVSFTFIMACIVFYGTRFIKLYIENNKVEEIDSLAKNIKDQNTNNDNFKNINGSYYFNGEDNDNYIEYSNLIWRIIKINPDNSVSIILNNAITSLAKGEAKEFNKTEINKWLNTSNEDYSGILAKNLNNVSKYLTYTKTCNDVVDDTKAITCKNQTSDTYITIPSINDYINTGSGKSFMNNDEYYYLINKTKENKSWYIDNSGKIGKNDGTDLLGIKPVITIKGTITKTNGNGSKEKPYKFEEESTLFGSYVKLNNDLWRIYEVNDNTVKLSLDDYLKINSEEKKYIYSNTGYYHNDSKANTLAYYLNKTYLNSLNYKDLIKETKYANGIYSNTTNFNYSKVLQTTVPTKVTVLSVGDPILTPTLTNYFTTTGVDKNDNNIYVMQNDFKLYTKNSSTSLKIVPVISINKDILTKGNGSKDTPWEVE